MLRMQQCAEGWHRDHEPDPPTDQRPGRRRRPGPAARHRGFGGGSAGTVDPAPAGRSGPAAGGSEDRTIGQTLTAPDGTVYRPSMFLTLTLPSYGPIISGTGTPGSPARTTIGARRWTHCISRSWSTGSGRTSAVAAGYRVQYFAALEPLKDSPPICMPRSAALPIERPWARSSKPSTSRLWWPPHKPSRLHRPRQLSGVGRRRLPRPADRDGGPDRAGRSRQPAGPGSAGRATLHQLTTAVVAAGRSSVLGCRGHSAGHDGAPDQ